MSFYLRKKLFNFATKIPLTMRLLVLSLFFSIGVSWANHTYAQNALISIDAQNQTIAEILEAVEQQSEFSFIYDSKSVDTKRKVSVHAEKESIFDVLSQMFTGSDIAYTVINKKIILNKSEEMLRRVQQGITIVGMVTDENGDPMPGVNVFIKGVSTGAVTDADGKYSVTVPNKDAVLAFSFIGYGTQEFIVGEQREINVGMAEESREIEEVVVVGYGTMKKRDVLGSIATLKADDIARTTPTSIDVALQGMTSGVTVTSSGVPGAPVQVKVRGINSISSGTDPLWIVDGIPVTSGTIDVSFNGETGQNILSMINPSDIESIQVLKDAAATAIYGSRGSNGVILVTTKKGKQGVNSFDVDIRTGVSGWTKTDVGIATGSEWIAIMDLARSNSKLGGLYEPIQSLSQLDTYQSVMSREEALETNTNWAKQISRMGNFFEARLSASNGSEKANSYLSLNYRKDNSNLKFNDMQMISANVNLNYKALNALTLGYRVLASYTDNNRVKSGDGKQGSGGWSQVNSNSLPWMKVYDPDGINGYWNSQSYINALASIDSRNAESNLQSLNLISGLTANWELPVNGLSLRGELGVNYVNSKGISWISKNVRELGARAEESKIQAMTTNYNAYFNYDRAFNEHHHLNLVAGMEGTRSSLHTTRLTGIDLVGPFHEIGTPGLLTGSSRLGGESYMLGIFGRANYNYRNKYYAGFSMRRDGISKFTEENRWANFLSGSLGWIISEEEFFNIEAINFLKLRGSYGQTGNTNIPTGITDDIWDIISGGNTLQETNNTRLVNIGNRRVKLETTSTLDVGFDFGLLNNRINGSVAWYKQKIEDMLLKVSLPLSAGITGDYGNAIWQNIGDMENYGWEVNLDAVVISKKDFRWSIGGNFSTNRNKVLALDPETDAGGAGFTPESDAASDSELRVMIKKGLPLGNWYMSEYAGVDSQRGFPLIYEIETLEDGSTRRTGNIIPATTTNYADNKMILDGKSSIPKIMGGFNMNLSYKGFDLNMIWNFAAGHYIYNRLKQSLMTPNSGLLTLSEELLTDTWMQAGDTKKYPMTTLGVGYFYNADGKETNTQVQYGSENKTPSTLYLEKGDYLRLKNVQLGYNLPQKWCNAARMKNIRVYLSGTNLLTFTKFTGYDPEVEIGRNSISSVVFFSALPQSRIYSLGISAKF